jgi:hypothetical protein
MDERLSTNSSLAVDEISKWRLAMIKVHFATEIP